MTRYGAAGLLLLFTAACAGEGDRFITLEVGAAGGAAAAIVVEVADTPAALDKGLSGRDSLPSNQGMLFVITQRGPGFWNKDVSFPLSVAFVSRCGVIVDIQDMAAHSQHFHDTPHDFRFGLEANLGWFERHGVGVGNRLRLPEALTGSGCAG